MLLVHWYPEHNAGWCEARGGLVVSDRATQSAMNACVRRFEWGGNENIFQLCIRYGRFVYSNTPLFRPARTKQGKMVIERATQHEEKERMKEKKKKLKCQTTNKMQNKNDDDRKRASKQQQRQQQQLQWRQQRKRHATSIVIWQHVISLQLYCVYVLMLYAVLHSVENAELCRRARDERREREKERHIK